ncbi:hypothetical protein [Oleiharenicola lentus]|uniref:hypothetical protein n=1 Tax=Oleiharenicola lentus TaxID=2508720 RepID=UPI003F676B0F
MKKFIAPLFLFACSLLFLSGCGTNSKIIAVGLRPEILSIDTKNGGVPAVTWQIVNTNIVPYLLSKVENKIFVNGQLVGTSKSTKPMAVPQQTNAGNTDILELASGGAGILSAAAGTNATYRVETTIIIQIYGDTTEKSQISNTGSVAVK